MERVGIICEAIPSESKKIFYCDGQDIFFNEEHNERQEKLLFTPNRFQCESEGLFPDYYDCSIFYRCIDRGESSENSLHSRFTSLKFQCGGDSVFDIDSNSCTHTSITSRFECRTEYLQPLRFSIPRAEDLQNSADNSNNGIDYGVLQPQGGYQTPQQQPSYGMRPGTDSQMEHMGEVDNTISEPTPPRVTRSPPCSADGFFSIENDCSHFYRCVSNGKGFTKYEFACGEGTVWDPDNTACNYPWAVQRTDCKSTNGDGNEGNNNQYPEPEQIPLGNPSTESTSLNTSPNGYPQYPQATSEKNPNYGNGDENGNNNDNQNNVNQETNKNKNNSCSSEGFYSVQNDCKKFIRCVSKENGGYTKYEFECAEGTVWDVDSVTCNYPYAVQRTDCKTDPNSQTSSNNNEMFTTVSGSSISQQNQSSESNQQSSSASSSQQSSTATSSTSGQQSSSSSGNQSSIGNNQQSSASLGQQTTPSFGSQSGSTSSQQTSSTFNQQNNFASTSSQETSFSSGQQSSTTNQQSSSSAFGQQTSVTGSQQIFTSGNNSQSTVSSNQQSQQGSTTGYNQQNSTSGSNSYTTSNNNQQTSSSSTNEQTSTTGSNSQSTLNNNQQVTSTSQQNTNSSQQTSTTGVYQTTNSMNQSINQNKDRCSAEGFFPSFANCNKFYRCVKNEGSGYTKYEFNCGPGTVWDPDNNVCNHPWAVQNERCRSDSTNSSGLEGTSNNTKPINDISTTTSTYQSSEKPITNNTTTMKVPLKPQTSTPNTYETSSTKKPGSGTVSSTSKPSPTTTKSTTTEKFTTIKNTKIPQEITSNNNVESTTSSNNVTTTSSIITSSNQNGISPQGSTKPSNNITCTKGGFYPYPGNCKKFYRCVDWDGDKGERFSVYYFDCPEGTIFDPNLNICNHENSVYPPRDCNANGSSELNNSTNTTENSISTTSIEGTTQNSTDSYTEQPTTGSQETTVVNSTGTTAMMTDSTTEMTTSETSTLVTQSITNSPSVTSTEYNTAETTNSVVPGITTTTTTSEENTGSTSGQTTLNPTTTETTTISSTSSSETCPELGPDQFSIVCPTGFRRHPKYCNVFYQCTISQTNEIKVLTLSCTNGTIYDDKRIQCLPPEQAKKCDGSMMDTRNLRQISDTSLTPIPVKSEKTICPNEGSFSYKEDCRLFYKCKKDNEGKISGFIYQCPEGFSYWNVSKRCEKSEKVPCDGEKKSTAIWKSALAPVEMKNIGQK
ncbi:hypothetical protein PGB90_008002 [Kerria lacca]